MLHIANQESRSLIKNHTISMTYLKIFPQGEYCVNFLNSSYCNSDNCVVWYFTLDTDIYTTAKCSEKVATVMETI